jgi:hypothetical protein
MAQSPIVPKQQQKTAMVSSRPHSASVITLNKDPSEAIGMATTPITDIRILMIFLSS